MRLALRRLLHRKTATIVSVVTLGLAIGSAAATWSLFSALIVSPLPVTAPERLVVVGRATRASDGQTYRSDGFIYSDYESIRSLGVFDGLAAGGVSALLVGTGSYPERRDVFFASADYFGTLGV